MHCCWIKLLPEQLADVVHEVAGEVAADQRRDQLHPRRVGHGRHQQVVHHAAAQGAASENRIWFRTYSFCIVMTLDTNLPAQLTG